MPHPVRICLFFCISLSVLYSRTEKQLILPELVNPHCMRVSQGEILVLQEGTVLVYAQSDGKKLREFGGSGEGPGESQMFGKRGNMLWADDQRVMVDSLQKVTFFTREGLLVQEIKKPNAFFFNIPAGSGFVSLCRQQTQGGEMIFELRKSTESFTNDRILLRQKPGASGNGLDLFPDALNFAVMDNGLIGEQEGDLIWIASSGESTKRIKLPKTYVPLSDVMKRDMLECLSEDWEIRKMGGIDVFRSRSHLRITPMVPAVRELSADGDLAFIWTNVDSNRANTARFWIVEISTGRYLGHVVLPMHENVALDDAITGRIDRYYDFDGDGYFTLRYDIGQEVWRCIEVNWRKGLHTAE